MFCQWLFLSVKGWHPSTVASEAKRNSPSGSDCRNYLRVRRPPNTRKNGQEAWQTGQNRSSNLATMMAPTTPVKRTTPKALDNLSTNNMPTSTKSTNTMGGTTQNALAVVSKNK
ncbi:hypothetical protein HAX54_044468 [Datura stramonium]|uniref:Secreted protein n=1 Tax=Datura stramonium TaxID=4076 RepID=A0ABS8SP83_DATST|nr:hypothetical protein [Datura stramonium]